MNIYPYETFSIKEEDLNFRQFHITARYTITSSIKCQKLYEFSKENKFSFFNLCVAAIYRTLEDIPELKQYIIDGECRQYEHTNVIIPLLKEDNSTEDICIGSIDSFNSFKEWDDYLQNIKENPEDYLHIFKPEFLNQPFAILSCLPWMDYTGLIDMINDSDSYFPIVHWGKYENGKISVTITSNHTFVYGFHLGIFFNKLSHYMDNPNSIFPESKIEMKSEIEELIGIKEKLNKHFKRFGENVIVGDYTYGFFDVLEWDNKTKLKIGKFSSIAADVLFFFGRKS